jgi:hypothetical protein
MSFHLALYNSNATQNVDTDLAAVSDNILTIVNGHFLPQRPCELLFSAAASTNLARARVETPTLRQLARPFIRPVSGAVGWGYPQRIDDMRDVAVQLRATEEIQMYGFQTGAAAEQVFGAIGLGFGGYSRPAGSVSTMRGTSTTAAGVRSWTQLGSISWTDTLPQGVYAVVGLEVQSATAIAARVIFEQQSLRPGSLSIQSLGTGVDEMFRNGGMGEWGRFNSYALPNIEVFCNAADAAHEIYLDLIKVG